MNFKVDQSWTLFLDRDGVINEKIENDYVKNWSQFKFIEGSLEAISIFTQFFNKIIIVTNQRGVGKGLMTELDLINIHCLMLKQISQNSGRIDKIYYCLDIDDSSYYRKPNIGMALQAKSEFNNINFNKSIIVGDSLSDMIFGQSLGMTCVFISNKNSNINFSHYRFNSLNDFATNLFGDASFNYL